MVTFLGYSCSTVQQVAQYEMVGIVIARTKVEVVGKNSAGVGL